MLIVTAGINFLLMLLMATAQRPRAVHGWFALLTASAAMWALTINGFLTTSQTQPSMAMLWAHAYYLAGTGIIYGLFEFCLQFPRRVAVGRGWHWVAAGGALLMAIVALMNGGLVHGVFWQDGGWMVELAPIAYILYTTIYLIFILGALQIFVRSILETRRRHHRRLSRTLILVGAGTAISLACGVWFNLLLPLFGRYDLIWAGPPCAIIFALVVLVAIIRQGILDLRQAVSRTIVYVALVAALIIMYSSLVFGVLQLFSPLITNDTVRSLIQTCIAVSLAFVIQPIWHLLDRVMSRIFYRETYQMGDVLERLREVTTSEVRTRQLASGVLTVLRDVLHVRFASLYIYGEDGFHVTQSQSKPTPYQQQYRDACAKELPATLPSLLDVGMLREVTDARIRWLFEEGGIEAVLQLRLGKQRIGLLMLGRKANDKHLSAKDVQLLTMISDELALAVQNTLRFKEIETFNDTLQQRVADATKELRTSNRELQKLDEAKDEFVSMASHQLRTPLTSVKGYIDMVLQGDAGKISAMQRQLLTEAFASSERMVRLINDFLNVSRLQTGKFMLDRRLIDLAKVVGQEVESLRTTASSRSLTLQYRSPSHFPMLYLDEDKLRQVVMNFVDNAIYYSREQSTIKVRLSVEAGEAILEVHDTGIGVPKAEQAHLFKKFFRATNARRQRPDGTGVGLYLAKRVITDHGGQILFRSTEGEGSVFGFRLPVRPLSTAPAEDAN